MCVMSTPENQSKSLLIVTRIPERGKALGEHFERQGHEVHYASSGEVLTTVQLHEPDYLLMAARFDDGTDGIVLCRAVRALPRLATKCLLLLPAGFHEYSEAFFADASGYVYDTAPIEEMEIALTCLSAGQRYFHSAVSHQLGSIQQVSYQKYLVKLSRREQEIFRYVSYGYTTPEIASQLYISVKTVETHKMNIACKLGFTSAAELRRTAMQLVARGVSVAMPDS